MCWSAAQQKSSEFCSSSCQESAQGNGPILLEALRGHVTFQESEWPIRYFSLHYVSHFFHDAGLKNFMYSFWSVQKYLEDF